MTASSTSALVGAGPNQPSSTTSAGASSSSSSKKAQSSSSRKYHAWVAGTATADDDNSDEEEASEAVEEEDMVTKPAVEGTDLPAAEGEKDSQVVRAAVRNMAPSAPAREGPENGRFMVGGGAIVGRGGDDDELTKEWEEQCGYVIPFNICQTKSMS